MVDVAAEGPGDRLDRLMAGPGFGRALLVIAAVGVVTGILAMVMGLAFIGAADEALTASAELTADTVEALDAAITVATASVTALSSSLSDLATTTEALAESLESAQTLLASTADLLRHDFADALTAVEDSMPALIDVAATVDTTLSALALIPFGPDYNPTEPFDVSLTRLADGLEGLPDQLRVQADLIDATAGDLSGVGSGIAGLFDDLASLQTQLGDADAILNGYQATAADALATVEDAAARLASQAVFARIAVVLASLTFIAGQVVPFYLGRRILAVRSPEAETPPG